ncbi:hypothetical protein HaLaN_17603 [Haematococcus lacustris]|uniref:Uncharacterized protein n=1 Tax=Haematococcus lacustris TaxID=44745 RepID=A0A699ZNG9_HAELA|nr:hypothetical protein HaLaN_17603 [Haematococcus lacustris]
MDLFATLGLGPKAEEDNFVCCEVYLDDENAAAEGKEEAAVLHLAEGGF